MTTSLNQSSTIWNSELGEFISEAHAHLAAVLHDYKPTFSLVYIPKKDRDATDTKPWAILDSPANLPPHIIRYLSDEEMKNPAAILQWIFEGDLTKHRPSDVFSRMESARMAEELLALKKREDELEDIIEFGAFVAVGGREKKHTFKHNGQTYRR